jgi:hypothetical protein
VDCEAVVLSVVLSVPVWEAAVLLLWLAPLACAWWW